MAEELDPSMLPNWLRDMDDGPSVRPGADDCPATDSRGAAASRYTASGSRQ